MNEKLTGIYLSSLYLCKARTKLEYNCGLSAKDALAMSRYAYARWCCKLPKLPVLAGLFALFGVLIGATISER